MPNRQSSESKWASFSKVLGCHLAFISTYGIATSFGVYQSFYELEFLTSYSPAAISWIGTTQVFLLGFISVIAGPLYDHGRSRLLLCLGCGLVVFGQFMLSLSQKYWHIFLSQALCIGIGSGLLYVPAIAVVTHAFNEDQAVALGVAATGSAVGGTILPVMFRRLQPEIGFEWTNRIYGLLFSATSIALIFLLDVGSNRPERRSNPFLDMDAFKDLPFIFLCAGLFFVELGFWIPPFTLTPYAELSLGVDADYAFYLLAIMNAGGFTGRVLPAYVSQIRKIGPAWILVAGSISLGILVLSWIAIRNVTGVTIWAILLGFMSGITVSIPNAVLPKLSSPENLGARSGMMWSFVAFAALIGAPIAAILVDRKTNTYQHAQLFSGLSICLGASMLCVPAIFMMKRGSN